MVNEFGDKTKIKTNFANIRELNKDGNFVKKIRITRDMKIMDDFIDGVKQGLANGIPIEQLSRWLYEDSWKYLDGLKADPISLKNLATDIKYYEQGLKQKTRTIIYKTNLWRVQDNKKTLENLSYEDPIDARIKHRVYFIPENEEEWKKLANRDFKSVINKLKGKITYFVINSNINGLVQRRTQKAISELEKANGKVEESIWNSGKRKKKSDD